jgi:hypothetical protein
VVTEASMKCATSIFSVYLTSALKMDGFQCFGGTCFVHLQSIILILLWIWIVIMNRDSSVGIATGYGLGFDSKQGQESFLLLHSLLYGSGTQPASSEMGITDAFLG